MLERIKIAALYADGELYNGKEVTVMGWVRNLRDMKNFGFIELNDGSCFKSLQVVFERESLENYEEYLEKRLTNALESVDGVGRTEIVITLKSSGQKIVEKDQSINNQSDSNTNEAGITNSSESKSSDGTSIYERQSDGTEIPYVSKELTPEIAGVLVVADGGDNAVVVKNITDAIRALFGVEAHKIKIMKRTDT